MKKTISTEAFKKFNKTIAIEQATGMQYTGDAITINSVTKQKTVHQMFETDNALYVLSNFDTDTLTAELKPKDFSAMKNVEFERI